MEVSSFDGLLSSYAERILNLVDSKKDGLVTFKGEPQGFGILQGEIRGLRLAMDELTDLLKELKLKGFIDD